MTDPLRLLSLTEAADALGLTRDNTRALCEQRLLGAIRIGREWRIPPESLALFRVAVAEGKLAPLKGALVILSEGRVTEIAKRGAA